MGVYVAGSLSDLSNNSWSLRGFTCPCRLALGSGAWVAPVPHYANTPKPQSPKALDPQTLNPKILKQTQTPFNKNTQPSSLNPKPYI